MDECSIEDRNSTNIKQFFSTMSDPKWAQTASEKTIDSLFKQALELQEILSEREKQPLKELFLENPPNLKIKRILDVVIESIIKNQILDEHITLYAINKYMLVYSKEDFSKLLEKLFSEVELRNHMYKLIEDFSDVELDLIRLNKFLHDILNASDLRQKVENNLKSQTLTFLKALNYGEVLTVQSLIEEVILCLEAQTDLRLWFTILKENNLSTVLDLCMAHSNFFDAVLNFFDKFAEEVESNYDEELNVQYSHVNLDFEDFVKILQLFLNQTALKKKTTQYLNNKTLTDKNYCFWIDVKACL